MKISFWRIFWPTLIAIIVASLIGIFSFLGILGGVVASFSVGETEEDQGAILRMKLEGTIFENSKSELDPYSFSVKQQIGLSDLLFGLAQAKKDKSIKGLYIELSNVNAGYSTLKELKAGIEDFKKSGKFIVAYNSGEMLSLKQLYLTSSSIDNYGFPSTHVEFLGLGREYDFYFNTLSKVGVEMQVIRGYENHFKSAVEPYIHTKLSDSARLQTQLIYTNIWGEIKKDLAVNTGVKEVDLEKLAENATITTVNDAVKFKLLKGVKYQDEVDAILAKKIGLSKDQKLNFVDFEKYAKKLFYENQSLVDVKNPSVAVILAEGEISVDGKELSSDKVAAYIREARLEKTIKTIVLRVNSPGGSALASDIIWREVVLANKIKPVIVSMGDLAASGGYYISTPASYIFAEPTTITGSIGVFGVIPFTGKLFEEKLGITFDRVQTNKHAVLSLNRKLTSEEIAIVQKEVNGIYSDFLSKVALGRKMTKNQVHRIARGRVWTGEEAKKIGLVDELGGLNEAINFAIKKAKLNNPVLKYWPLKKVEPLEAWIEELDNLKENSKISISQKKIPKLVEDYLHTISTFEKFEGIQMRIPHYYELK
jgi:protease-4